MNGVVLDSGVLIASVFPETLTSQAKKLIQQLLTNKNTFHAPVLLRYEIVAVCRKAVYQGRVIPEESSVACDHLLSFPIELYFDADLLKRGYELATKYSRPTAYDAQYLALAERLDYPFWTVDERLFNSVKAQFPNIHWLGNDNSSSFILEN